MEKQTKKTAADTTVDPIAMKKASADAAARAKHDAKTALENATAGEANARAKLAAAEDAFGDSPDDTNRNALHAARQAVEEAVLVNRAAERRFNAADLEWGKAHQCAVHAELAEHVAKASDSVYDAPIQDIVNLWRSLGDKLEALLTTRDTHSAALETIRARCREACVGEPAVLSDRVLSEGQLRDRVRAEIVAVRADDRRIALGEGNVSATNASGRASWIFG